MLGQAGFFDVDERLKELSARATISSGRTRSWDFEAFRADLAKAVPRSDGSIRQRMARLQHQDLEHEHVIEGIPAALRERAEFLIKDRLSFMRFLGLGLSDPVPDANTIWTFREALTRVRIGGKPGIEMLFGAYDTTLRKAGFLAMGGQIVWS